MHWTYVVQECVAAETTTNVIRLTTCACCCCCCCNTLMLLIGNTLRHTTQTTSSTMSHWWRESVNKMSDSTNTSAIVVLTTFKCWSDVHVHGSVCVRCTWNRSDLRSRAVSLLRRGYTGSWHKAEALAIQTWSAVFPLSPTQPSLAVITTRNKILPSKQE